jgi:hypothetical protein
VTTDPIREGSIAGKEGTWMDRLQLIIGALGVMLAAPRRARAAVQPYDAKAFAAAQEAGAGIVVHVHAPW